MVDYFTTLFRSGGAWNGGEVVACVGGKVDGRQNDELIRPFSVDEIREAVFQISATKSPCPNGFTTVFFQDHWEVVGDDIIRMVQAFHHSRRLLKKINHTHIVLIPKVKAPRQMTELRLISLCNVVYKVIAKLLTKRLKYVMDRVISYNQSAFVPGR